METIVQVKSTPNSLPNIILFFIHAQTLNIMEYTVYFSLEKT